MALPHMQIWNIDVRYELSEDPKTILSVSRWSAGWRWLQHGLDCPPCIQLHENRSALVLSCDVAVLLNKLRARPRPHHARVLTNS